MILVKEVTDFLESIAPLSYQESYDNSGLITGNPQSEIRGILVCLDSTEDVIMEAIEKGCNLVIAHHPIIFSGLKKITGKNYVERTILLAIKNDISIYAIHTNLDNVSVGVNKMIGEKLGLKNLKILSPKSSLLRKLVTFCPVNDAEKVKNALFKAGAGNIGNYSECSFSLAGEGQYRGNEASNPVKGEKGKRHTENELRIEVIFENYRQNQIISALLAAHPYEEVAYDIYDLVNKDSRVGSGMVGELTESQNEKDFLVDLKKKMKASSIRHTALLGKNVKKIAICGGSGSFLLQDAIFSGADVFITADYKYHQFFDADGKILIADIGHFESEQFTMDLIKTLIIEKFSTFAVRITEVNTNPVFYM